MSLEVREEEILCLLGPSGCGKTTILRLAAGLELPTRGTIQVGGRLVSGNGAFVPPERRDVGLLFQDYALFPHLSIAGNIAFGLRSMSEPEQKQRIGEMLKLTHLSGRGDTYPHTLSGGEQQRVALARALAPRPRVLLLDEPFSGLDTQLRQKVRDETLHVLKEVGAAVVLVTHDPEEALFMADRIALMKAGRIVQVGEPTDLYFHPAEAFAAEFFGEINRLSSRVSGGKIPSPFGPLTAGGPARRDRSHMPNSVRGAEAADVAAERRRSAPCGGGSGAAARTVQPDPSAYPSVHRPCAASPRAGDGRQSAAARHGGLGGDRSAPGVRVSGREADLEKLALDEGAPAPPCGRGEIIEPSRTECATTYFQPARSMILEASRLLAAKVAAFSVSCLKLAERG